MSEITACRVCGSSDIRIFLSLGDLPPSDALRTEEHLKTPQKRYPLNVAFCGNCTLVQITETVPPEELFGEAYLYFSSFSDALLRHTKAHVERQIEARSLGPDSLVVEAASNDGYLLQYYVERGVPVLGVDPAPNQAKAANDKGVNTLCDFFGQELADKLVAEGRQADVIHGNNVLAHVADTNDFVAGAATLLKDDGIAVFEFPYVVDLIDHCEFDTIYHEHICYFSAHALTELFGRHGLSLNRIDYFPELHGGTIRVQVAKGVDVEQSVRDYIAREKELGADTFSYYETFAERVVGVKTRLREILDEAKAAGKTIAGYGAAAKGAILLNYCEIGPEYLDFIVDRNVHKHGRYMPGVDIPITGPEKLLEAQPDYTLLLPWNFKTEIMAQQAEYREKGGRFIIPIPYPEIV